MPPGGRQQAAVRAGAVRRVSGALLSKKWPPFGSFFDPWTVRSHMTLYRAVMTDGGSHAGGVRL
jgi:hypothetical protein